MRDPKRSATSAFGSRDFRILFAGQIISMPGTFVQTAAQAWLVLDLTHSSRALGLVVGLQFLPMLVIGGPAGVLIDRMDRRALYVMTQTFMGLLALGLGLLTVTGMVTFPAVAAFAFVLGMVTSIDQPTKIALNLDLVGRKRLSHAVGLTNALANVGRVVGPPIAALCIATLGTGACFLINGASYVAVVLALVSLRVEHREGSASAGERGAFRAGLRYARTTPEMLRLLGFSAVFFCLAWQYDVTLPLLARMTFDGGPGTFGLLASALGLGAVASATLRRPGPPSIARMQRAAIIYALATLVAAVAPHAVAAGAALFVAGFAATNVATALSSRLQLRARPDMRGRVIALWTVAVLGTRPIGAPLCGAVADALGARWALALGVVTPLALWVAVRGRGFAEAEASMLERAQQAAAARQAAAAGP
jgi:MFS family permease